MIRIGELASATGASTRSLRYYEQQGLLVSERSASGQRYYTESAAERVRLIRSLLDAGLSSTTIYDVLPCLADEAIRTPLLQERLDQELHRLDEQIESMRTTRNTLAAVIADVEPSSPVR